MSETRKLPAETIAARPGLIAETQPPATLGKPFRELGDLLGAVRKCPHMAYFPAAQTLRHGHGHRRLVHIQTHEYGSVHQAHPPCLRLGAGPSGATLDRSLPWDGPPLFQAGEHRV